MKTGSSLPLLLACPPLSLFITGCVIFPHGDLTAPPASGQVLDAQGFQPVTNATVVRRVAATDQTRRTVTDSRGAFQLKKETELRWRPYFCPGPSPIHYRVEAKGYQPFETNRSGGGVFSGGDTPHNLGQVLIQRDPK